MKKETIGFQTGDTVFFLDHQGADMEIIKAIFRSIDGDYAGVEIPPTRGIRKVYQDLVFSTEEASKQESIFRLEAIISIAEHTLCRLRSTSISGSTSMSTQEAVDRFYGTFQQNGEKK